MERISFKHEGICVGPVSPMTPNRDIRLDSIAAYSEHLLASGVNGLFLNGTCAEGLSMTMAERKSVVEKWIEVGRGKYDKIVVHCGALCLRDARELAKHAEAVGADAISAVPSFYFPPNDIETLVATIAEVASAAPKTPFIYYHNPERTHVSMDMALFIQAAKKKIPTFAGIKWAASDLAGALRCRSLHGESIAVMWANDDILLAALAVGLRSFNGTTYSFTAKTANRIIAAYSRGDRAGAEKTQLFLKRVVDLLEEDGNWLQRHKAILEFLTGIAIGPARLPLMPLTETAVKKLVLGYTKLQADFEDEK